MDEQKIAAAPLLLGVVAVILGLTMAPALHHDSFGGVPGGDSARRRRVVRRRSSASAAAGEGGSAEVTVVYDDDGRATVSKMSPRVGAKSRNGWEQDVVWASKVGRSDVLTAQIEAESGWGSDSRANHAGASGLTQFIPHLGGVWSR